jgi:molecular chaperone HscB
MTDATHFERLGLPRRFRLDAAALEANYLARSRAVHPDHAGDAPESLHAAAALNEAYATLREPFRRAEYLLQVEGGPSAADVKQMPPEFLEEMLELRERIEAVKDVTDPDRSDRTNLELRLAQRRDNVLDDTAVRFERLEALPDGAPERAGALAGLRQALNAAKFLQGLLRDLREE